MNKTEARSLALELELIDAERRASALRQGAWRDAIEASKLEQRAREIRVILSKGRAAK